LGPSGKYCVTDAKKRSHIDDGRDKSRRFSLSSSYAVFLSNTLRPKPAGTKLLSPANIITIYTLVIKLARRIGGGFKEGSFLAVLFRNFRVCVCVVCGVFVCVCVVCVCVCGVCGVCV